MTTPFDPQTGLIVVSTRLWGPTGDTLVRLALDTGSIRSMIGWNLLMMLGYDPAAVTDRVEMTTASGAEFAPRIVVERIEALGQERKDYPVLCHTLPATIMVDGLLGLDFFRGQRLILDFRAGSVTLD